MYHHVIQSGHIPLDQKLKIIPLLKTAGVDIKTLAADDWTALHFAVFACPDAVSSIIECGVNVDAKTNKDKTAVQLFLGRSYNYEALKALSKSGATVEDVTMPESWIKEDLESKKGFAKNYLETMGVVTT
jgi:hypothetical protein